MSTPKRPDVWVGASMFDEVMDAHDAIAYMDYIEMSLRDYFAANAMSGMLANPEKDYNPNGVAEDSYSIADAMIAERKRKLTEPID